MRWYETIIAAHTAVTSQVSHMERLNSDRYFVWQENGRNDLEAGGIHAESAITGFTDLFTTVEFDSWAEEIQAKFDWLGIFWNLRDVQYEEETGITHYTWDWEVLDGPALTFELDDGPRKGRPDGENQY